MPDNDLDKIAKAFASQNNQMTNKKSTSRAKSNNSKKTSNGKTYWGKNYYKNPDLKNGNTSKSSTKSSLNKSVSKTLNSTLDKTISNTISNSGASNSQSNAVTKQIKKLPLKSKICIVLLFILGLAIGIGTSLFICRNDQFEILGKKVITLNVGDTYSDAGVTVIGFGIDMSKQVEIEVYKDDNKLANGLSDINTTEECSYQIKYKLNNFRFRNVEIIRTILVLVPDNTTETDTYVETYLYQKSNNKNQTNLFSLQINNVDLTNSFTLLNKKGEE